MGEWKRVKLGEVCTLVPGFAFKSGLFGEFPAKVIKITNIEDGISEEALSGVDVSGFAEGKLDKYLVTKGDYVVAMTGSIGKIGRVIEGKAYINQRVLTIRAMGLADKDFIYYLIRSKDFLNYMLTHVDSHSVQPNISAGTIGEYEFELPDLPTQRRIAAVLGALDDKIEVNRKICENLEAQAQALFKAWFVDDGSRIQTTKQMQEVFDVTIGRTPPRKEFEWFSESKDDNVTWASIADMGSCGMFLADSSEYLTPMAVQRFKLVMIPRGTVLLSFKLTVGRVAIADVDMVSNEAIAHLRTNNTAMREYLYCYLKQYDFDKLGSTSSIATAVNSTTIKEMPFRVPTDAALVDFHNVAKPIFDLIRSKSQESRALAAMRDALLPKLMRGEL